MEKELSRRDFLKIGSIGAGTLMLGSFLDSPVGNMIEKIGKIGNEKGKSGILESNFEPLESNFTLGNSNFDFFKGIIKEIDSTIHFKRGYKLEFRNNIFSIPYNFKYSDIPELIILLKKRINSSVFENVISRIKENYENKAYFIYKSSLNSQNKELYLSEALKIYSISCLYSGIKDQKAILSSFQKLINEDRIDKNEEKNIKKILIKHESQTRLSGIKINNFSFSKEDEKYFIKLKTLNEKYDFFVSKIEKYLGNSKIEIKEQISAIIKNIVLTKLKVYEIMGLSGNEILNGVKTDINSFLSDLSKNNTSKNKIELSQEIEKEIGQELKKDFEKGIYLSMTKDINKGIKNQINQSIIESVTVFENKGIDSRNYIEFNALADYITKKYKNEELIDFYTLIKKSNKPYPINKLILTLPQKNQKDVKKLLDSIVKTYESEKFKEIISDIKNGNFKTLKEKIKYLSDDEKANLLYLIFSNIGGNIYYDMISKKISLGKFGSLYSPKIESKLLKNVIGDNNKLTMAVLSGNGFLDTKERISNYQSGNFQINELKKTNGKYNCMTISAIGNYIIEDLFGLKGKGIAIFKQDGDSTNHIFNGIEAGEKMVWIDITNNEYSIVNKNSFDSKNYYDVMDFANAYLQGAVDNVGIDEGKKFFDSKKKLKYIKGYLNNSGDETVLSKANRDKAKYWRNL